MDEDDLEWVANEQNILLLFKKFHENFRSKNGKLSHSSEIQNDDSTLVLLCPDIYGVKDVLDQ